MNKPAYLQADWPQGDVHCPQNVHAFTTLRNGGFSSAGFSSFNLAGHVGDEAEAVTANRKKLRDELNLPVEPYWLEQVHSNKVIELNDSTVKTAGTEADASLTRTKGLVCAVLTADCLPVFFCDKAGTEVAVAHAGWRGLHAGILTNTIDRMQSSAENLMVSLGPAIGPKAFEVGEDVFSAFIDKNRENAKAFTRRDGAHYLCDIYQLGRIELAAAGVNQVAGGNSCTYGENERFYSYRRQTPCGRMASLIWMS